MFASSTDGLRAHARGCHLSAVGAVAAGGAWAPTPVVPVVVNLLSVLGDQQVAFRFTALDDGGEWTIDDVYVDPYKKG